MLSSIKQNFIFILQNAGVIDYLAYSWIVIAFIFLLLLGVYLAIKWWWTIGFLVIFFGFFGMIFGFYYVSDELNNRLRKIEISKINTKQLEYSNALMLDFSAKNLSPKKLKICKIDLNFYTLNKNKYKEKLNALNPFVKHTIFVNEISAFEEKDIKSTINNFAFVDYNITIKPLCF